MALKTNNKISASFNMSSMTDLVFLLLIFFMITSTLISPNALDLVLPKSSSQTNRHPQVTVSITNNLIFAVDKQVVDFNQIEPLLKEKLKGVKEPVISLHAEKDVPVDWVVKVMDIARRNRYKVILATSPK
jgi:biopolymer transport protein ExbD